MRDLLSVLDDVQPRAGAVVMGTGIVSTALFLDGSRTLSRILLVLAVAAWVALGYALVRRLAGDRDRLQSDARSPAGLTGVAGTAVLGTRFAQLGWTAVGAVLLSLAVLGWCALMPVVLRELRGRVEGVAFMPTVATEALAALAAELATAEGSRWLLDVAIVLAVAGLVLYPYVLVRFDLGQLLAGRGDHWVAGGSLAISALALAEIAVAAARTGAGPSFHSVLQDCALAVWAAAIVWLPPLVVAELRRPRLRYDTRRWATVFPFGMYAACSFAVATAAGAGWIGDFARIWVWVAFAVWLIVFAGMLRTARVLIATRPGGG